MLQTDKIIQLFGEAYREAVLARTNMRMASEAMETMLTAIISYSDIFTTWNILDDQVNQAAESEKLMSILKSLREDWKKIIFRDEHVRLQKIFETDSTTGWIAWLHSYVNALTQFRLDFAGKLCKLNLPFPESTETALNQIRLLTDRLKQGRWAELYDLYAILSENETLIPTLRVKLLVRASEIVAMQFKQFGEAKTFLEMAEMLDSQEWQLLLGWGNYFYYQPGEDNQVKAEEYFQRLITQYPNLSMGYTSLGELLEKKGDFEKAEENYWKAAKCIVLPINGYHSILKLYGQKVYFELHRNDIPRILRLLQGVALSELDYYESYLTAGYTFQLNSEYEEARHLYQQAIDFDPIGLHGYISLAYLYMDIPDYSNATKCFNQAIEVAPEAFDGYWGLAQVYEEKKNWQEAIHWCDECLIRRPRWHAFIHARIGNLKRNLGHYKEASMEFLEALKDDPDDNYALNGIEGIASELFEKQGNMEGALELYHQILGIAGKNYEGRFHNLVGNVYYYFRQYKEAAVNYNLATEANSGVAIYYFNAALAYEKFSTPGSVIDEIAKAISYNAKACKIQPEDAHFADNLRWLELKHIIATKYGEQALIFEPTEKPVLILVEQSITQLILNTERSDLSTDLLKKIASLREGILTQYGLILPSIEFTLLQAHYALPGDYQIAFGGKQVEYGQVLIDNKFALCSLEKLTKLKIQGKSPYIMQSKEEFIDGYWLDESGWNIASSSGIELIDCNEYLLRHLKATILKHIDKFCTHQLTSYLLSQLNNSKYHEIITDIRKLNRLTFILKDKLSQGGSIANLESFLDMINPEIYSEDGYRQEPESSSLEHSLFIGSIKLHINPSLPLEKVEIEQEIVNLQDFFFRENGVMIPKIELTADNKLNQYDFQLQFDDFILPVTSGLAPNELWIYVPRENIMDRFPDSRESIEPNSLTSATIIKSSEEVKKEIETKHYDYRDPLGYIIFCTAAEIRKKLDQVISLEVVQYYLTKLKKDYPDLLNATTFYFSEGLLTIMLRNKLRSEGSIKNLPGILETFLADKKYR